MLPFSACKLGVSKKIHRDLDKVLNSVQQLPAKIQSDLVAPTLAQTAGLTTQLIDQTKNVGISWTKVIGSELQETISTTGTEMQDLVRVTGSESNKTIRNIDTVSTNLLRLSSDIADRKLTKVSDMSDRLLKQIDIMGREWLNEGSVAAEGLIRLADELAQGRLAQVDDIANKVLTQVDKMRAESFDRSEDIINGILSKVDTMRAESFDRVEDIVSGTLIHGQVLHSVLDSLDIASDRKILLIEALARRDMKAFMNRLDESAVKWSSIIDKILERRTNQIFNRLNESMEKTLKELDKVLEKNIHRTYYMGYLVAENLLEAMQKSVIIMIIIIVKAIICIITFVYLCRLVWTWTEFDRATVIATLFFVTVVPLICYTNAIEEVVGGEYIKTEDVLKRTQMNIIRIEEMFNVSPPPTPWEIIEICAETMRGLELCKVLYSPNNNIQKILNKEIEKVNWFLEEALPDEFTE